MARSSRGEGSFSTPPRFPTNGPPLYPLDPTPATPWTTTEPDEQAMASAEWALQATAGFLGTLGLQMAGNPWQSVDGVGHQQVIINYVKNAPAGVPLAFYSPATSEVNIANIYFVITSTHRPGAPDEVSHEFSHAMLDSLRRTNGLPTYSGKKDAGSIDEGIADLFTIAFNHKTGVSTPWSCVNFPDDSTGVLDLQPGHGRSARHRRTPSSTSRLPSSTTTRPPIPRSAIARRERHLRRS